MRADGKRVKKADLLYTVVPHIMSKRYDAMNMITLDIPVEPLQHYINSQRKQGRSISHIGLVISAYLRTVAEYPLLNRFVVNKCIYDRNEFCVAMVVLKPDGETMSKMYFQLDDDLFTVEERIERFFSENQRADVENSTDKIARILGNVPGLLRFGVTALKFWDKYFGLPKAIIDASPFHTSLTVTNLASIRTNHIYHHTYEFGTTSVFVAMGNLREVPVRSQDQVVFRRCLPLGVVMDERICSGVYFANAFRSFRRYMSDPSLMEKPNAAQ